MDFYPNQTFHIYNQGNKGQQLFFSDDNYRHFLWKMRAYLPIFGDFVAWSLMPNHFHWLFFVKAVEVNRTTFWAKVDATEWERRCQKYGEKAQAVNRSHTRKASDSETVSLNEAIGIAERSYTQGLNQSEDERAGVLFRPHCKAKDGWIDEFVTIESKDKHQNYCFRPGTWYFYHCFNYIHENAVKAKLVKKASDWPYSSARDYAGLRRGSLCNLELGRELLLYM